ncbi:MAG: hypothetical protein CMJ78_02235 [Planctomycetaceae bacterium]|nr:hypothetical protein [Planctomycetaceae bacterium]
MEIVANRGTLSFLYMTGFRLMEHDVAITFLRDTLGITVQHVARTNEPVVIRRYNRADVIMVPLWEWRWLKQIETAIRDGEIDASGFLRNLDEPGETSLDEGAESR